MESQLTSPHGHHDNEQDSYASDEHDHGGHHDTSPTFMMKVKEKAKRVKDKFKKHGHLQGHGQYEYHHHVSDDQDSDEEEGKLANDAEVHGAPMYESGKTRDEPGQMEVGAKVESPTHQRFVGQVGKENTGMHSEGLPCSTQGGTAFDQGTSTNQHMDFGSHLEERPGESNLNLEKPSDMEVDSATLKNRNTDSIASNYQSKTTDPTGKGDEEIRTTPIDQHIRKISLNDTEPSQETAIRNETLEAISSVAPTGSQNQLSPDLAPPRPQNIESLPDTFSATNIPDQPEDSVTYGKPSKLSSYTSGLEIPKHNPESKRTPKDQENQSSYTPNLENSQDPEAYDGSKHRDQDRQSGHADQISSDTSVITDKSVAAKDGASGLGYGGDKEDAGMHREGADKSESYDDTKHLQGDQAGVTQANQSYMGMISSAASAIPAAVASRAISAKNVVSSKVGYGKKGNGTTEHQMQGEEQKISSGPETEHDSFKEQDKGSSYAGKISSSAASAIPPAVTDTTSNKEEANEDMTEDGDVHGAPMYESEKTRDEPGQMETTGHVGANVERQTHQRFDRQENENTEMHSGGLLASMQGNTGFDQGTSVDRHMEFGSHLQGSPGESKLNLEKPSDLEVDSATPKNHSTDSTASSFQSKATDPTAKGGEEIRTTPIDQHMGKITLNDTEPSQKPTIAYREAVSTEAPTGSQNQLLQEMVPPGSQNPEPVPETFTATKFADQPQDSIADGKPLNFSSYTSIPDNRKHDPDTYSERMPADQDNQSSYTPNLENPQHDPEDYDGSKPRDQEKQSGHTGKISSVTSAIADKAVAAKDVAPKLGYGGDKGDAGMHGEAADESESYDNTEHYPGDQPKEMQTNQRDSYTRKISSGAAAIPAAVASTAVSAKNVVASKQGYGEKDDNKHPIQEEESGAQQDSASKHEIGETAKEQSKGVPVKGKFSEKLKPGDEDKALSELISEALHRQKRYPQKTEHEEKPTSKVTESEDVPKRLGSEDDKSSEKEQSDIVNVPGGTMVDKLKGAVSSWFGGGESQTPQPSASSIPGQDSGHDSNIGG